MRDQALKPLFFISNRGGSFSDPRAEYMIEIVNSGNTAMNVSITLHAEGWTDIPIGKFPMFVRDSVEKITLKLNTPFPDSGATLFISYVDVLGNSGNASFSVTRQSPNSNSMLDFIRIEI